MKRQKAGFYPYFVQKERKSEMAEKFSQDNFEKVLSEKRPVLVDFYSDACVPCKKLSPVFAQLEERYGEQMLFGKVNAGYEPELVKQYHISGTPTLVFFKGGEAVETIEKAVKKEELEEKIIKHLSI